MSLSPRQHLESIFRAGVAACHPSLLVPPHLPEPPQGRTIVLALGKAAVPMARAVEENWQGPLFGVAVTRHGAAGPLRRLDVMTAGHPVPDQGSLEAARRIMALADSATAEDLVLVLLSGGASALACLPGDGLSLGEKQRVTSALVRSGAAIGEINCVRRHLSAIKGGRLAAAAYPASLVTLAISDVAGERPADIGSGPTAPDPTTTADARAVLRRYGIEEPELGWSESLKSVEADYRILASARDAVDAAAARAAELGYAPRVVGYDLTGEARDVGEAHGQFAGQTGRRTALISGGELTVTVRGGGSGGPNQEYALALALALQGKRDIYALAADTDGIDGSGEAAGAFIHPETLRSGAAMEALHRNDSGGFFAAAGDLFVTGPTGTNVNDLRIILVDP
ncbi:MAG TPA: glycerate kinase [Allosphingosinicella sp.]|jgi:hydroxypyruvate reductase